ncbi:MAG: hypothetical protein RL721_1866 [Candidatus Eisenbacteria bacterium]|jgi:uncharacterized protein (TIGR00251 family)
MRLALRVQPGARRNALLGRLASGEWKVAVAAPPLEGRANEAVVEWMSELLGVKRRQVAVVRGASSRGKVIEVEGLSEAEAHQRLTAALAAERPGSNGAHDDGE